MPSRRRRGRNKGTAAAALGGTGPPDDPAAAAARKLFKLVQSSSLEEYNAAFSSLANQVVALSEQHLLSCYISGLRDELQPAVLATQPRAVERAMVVAKQLDDDERQVASRPAALPLLGGKIGGTRAVFLVSISSGQNFLDIGVAKNLGLPVEEVPGVTVRNAAGIEVLCAGLIKAVAVRLNGGVEFVSDFLIVDLRGGRDYGYDGVLGNPWISHFHSIMFARGRLAITRKDGVEKVLEFVPPRDDSVHHCGLLLVSYSGESPRDPPPRE